MSRTIQAEPSNARYLGVSSLSLFSPLTRGETSVGNGMVNAVSEW